jgi:arylsulfatase A-like enzyme
MMGSHQLLSKQRLYEEAAAVPLIVVPPGAKKGLDKEHLVSGLDILPTALDYAGIAAPASLKGLSLKPLVEGKSAPWREFVASETSADGEARMIRTARYKYIVYSTGEDREQFFDVEKDPGEVKNLIAASAQAGEVARHRGLLEQWMKDTKDIFGKTPAPVKDKKDKKSGAVDREKQLKE